jgi:YHS domain-containing protein
MNKNLLVFLCTFAAGCVVALAVRSSLHDPYAETQNAEPAAAAPAPATPTASPHEGHGDAQAEPGDSQPVNSICAICGMKVNPKIETAMYDGKTIGFGCKRCPPKFAKDPDRYGPAALEDKVVEQP